MRHSSLSMWVGVVLVTLIGCREEPGDIEYRASDFTNPNPFALESITGPDPYVPGEERLSFGVFYEGDASTVWVVDDANVFYFIYQVEATQELTYGQSVDDDRIEGTQSNRWTHRGLGFWGGGIHFAAPRDLSEWTTIHVSFKSSDPGFASVNIGMNSEGGNGSVKLEDYGYTNDGQWHTVAIPILDLQDAGVDITQVTAGFTFGGANAAPGEAIRIDNLYFE